MPHRGKPGRLQSRVDKRCKLGKRWTNWKSGNNFYKNTLNATSLGEGAKKKEKKLTIVSFMYGKHLDPNMCSILKKQRLQGYQKLH